MEREPGVYEYEMEAEEGTDLRREVNKVVQEHGWAILLMKSSELTLEDIFLKITMGEGIEPHLNNLKKRTEVKSNERNFQTRAWSIFSHRV